jgi:SAM-dependent methyltransferase
MAPPPTRRMAHYNPNRGIRQQGSRRGPAERARLARRLAYNAGMMETGAERRAAAALRAAIMAHREVADCAALSQADGEGARRLVAYVAPRPGYGRPREAGGGTREAGQIALWQARYEATYGAGGAEDPTFDTAGWRDLRTGAPLPPAEMAEWVGQTVARIRLLRPARALEIGCGTGLLLFRLAPDCGEYWGTDFAGEALRAVRAGLARAGAPRAPLLRREADDFAGIPEGHFDTVILNSVSQYFPGPEYLLRVLRGAVRALAPGGHLFIGDVRSLPLLRAFHATIERQRRPRARTRGEARARVAARMDSEQELLIDPRFFLSLPARLPEVSAGTVLLKRGRRRDELTCFRYDAILRVGGEPTAPPQAVEANSGLTLPLLRPRLATRPDQALAWRDIGNARLQEAALALAWLDGSGGASGGGTAGAREALDPEAVCAAGEEMGFAVDVRPAQSGAWDRFDALFRPRVDGAAPPPYLAPAPAPGAVSDGDLHQFTNQPRDGSEARAFVRELRRYLAQERPEAPAPAVIVLLDALPRRAGGGLDLSALPALEPAPGA